MLASRVASRRLRVRSLHIAFGASSIPHPVKAASGGEDAFFADDATGAFGVADGVGGSKRNGADPGLFSRRMLDHCRKSLADEPHALQKAMAAAASGFASNPIGGSSTLLLGSFDGSSGIFRLLNLGDSGALLFRPARRKFQAGTFTWPRVVMRSFDQTHYFNCPYQVAADDFDGAANEADELQTTARVGDIVVAATDGVLDNVFESRIQVHVAQLVGDLLSKDPLAAQAATDKLAKSIAEEANATGLREDEEGLQTPFMMSAAQEGYRFDGGKLDDVAVVCGVVRRGERPPQRKLSNIG